jgi:hypothetical protein
VSVFFPVDRSRPMASCVTIDSIASARQTLHPSELDLPMRISSCHGPLARQANSIRASRLALYQYHHRPSSSNSFLIPSFEPQSVIVHHTGNRTTFPSRPTLVTKRLMLTSTDPEIDSRIGWFVLRDVLVYPVLELMRIPM